MESRWYLSPGQTLENTKIEDRNHALHITRRAWNKITAHLDRNRLIQEAIEKEEAHRRALKEGSEAMTKNWDNSVENIRKRKEEEHQLWLTRERDGKMQNFLKLREEQEGIRQKFIQDERKAIYISKGPPKSINSALIQAEVLYEREKQRELEESIKEHERDEAKKYAELVNKNAAQEKLENMEKEKKLLEKKLEMREIYLKEINTREELNKLDKQKRITEEQEDNIRAEREAEKMKHFEEEEARKVKAAKKLEFKEFYEKQEKSKKQLELEDKEQELVINIYSQAKHRIDCLRKKKEKEMQDALIKRREAASKQAVAEAQAKTEAEEHIMKKAIEARDKQELEKLQAKQAYQKELIKEREEYRQRCLEQEEKRKLKEKEWEKWQMLNRFKQDDMTNTYERDKKEKLWRETLQYRQELLEQMAENEAIRGEEKAEDDMLCEYSKAKLKEEDERFFEYAEEVYDYAKRRGRTTEPIERVILEYKKENNLPYTIHKPCENYKRHNCTNNLN